MTGAPMTGAPMTGDLVAGASSEAGEVEPVRILIVDDHVMVAVALARVLDATGTFSVVGVCADRAEAMEILSRSSVDVALVDLRLGSEDGTVLIREIRTGWPETAVLVVSGASDADNVSRAMDSGCHGYLLKGQPMHELIAGIEAVARGERAFAPDVREFVQSRGDLPALSAREIELLRLLVSGAATSEIAGELYISGHTVRNHVKSVLGKLGAHSRAEAVAIALRRRLVDISPEG